MSDVIDDLVEQVRHRVRIGDPNLQIQNAALTHTLEDVIAEFNCHILSPPTSGNMILRLEYSDTANTEPGKYSYDVLLTSSSDKIRAVEGTVEITPNITTD